MASKLVYVAIAVAALLSTTALILGAVALSQHNSDDPITAAPKHESTTPTHGGGTTPKHGGETTPKHGGGTTPGHGGETTRKPTQSSMRPGTTAKLTTAVAAETTPAPIDPTKAKGWEDSKQFLLGAMNLDADPCQDFFEYSCGKWNEAHKLKPDQKRNYIYDGQQDEVFNQTIQVLDDLSDFDPESTALRKAGLYFDTCYEASKGHKAVDIEAVKSMVEDLGGWHLIDSTLDLPDLSKVLGQVHQHFYNLNGFTPGVGPIISSYVAVDMKDVKVFSMQLDEGSLGLGAIDYYLNDTYAEVKKNYTEKITRLARLIAGSELDIEADVEKIVAFETRLAEIMTRPEDTREAEDAYHNTKFDDIKSIGLANFTWNEYYASLLQDTDRETPEYVIVGSLDIDKLAGVLGSTDATVVWNYMVAQAVLTRSDFIEDLDNNMRLQWHQKMIDERGAISQLDDDQATCASHALSFLPWAAGRAYVDRHFDEMDRNILYDMVQRTMAAFGRTLKTGIAWMDDPSKMAAQKKLANFAVNIGWPTWVKHDFLLDNLYDDIQLVKGQSFIEMFNEVTHKSRLRELGRMGHDVNRHDFGMSPATVNAWYDPTLNSITIPAAILGFPSFRQDLPMSLNYGQTGNTIGHEMTHGFDDEGVQFDYDGTLHPWISKKSSEGFRKMADCVVDEYSKFCVDFKGRQLCLNGKTNQGENIADNGGIRASYSAYMDWINANGREAALEDEKLKHMTNEQLYFVGFGLSWCGVESKEYLEKIILTNPHSPPKYRVLGTLKNFPEFGKAFGCKIGDPMYPKPEDKCDVWV